MKIQRKLAGFSACALVLSSLTVPVAHAASTDFKDIDSHWAKSSIERWAGYEIVNGFGNNEFKPEDTMTRAQMAQILSKTLGLTATATTNPFTDVSDSDWFKDAILKCSAAGIMNGTSATTANPNAQISRQDAVTMMGRALGIEADGNSTTFNDNGSIGAWAVGFVNAMSKRGIVNGRSEGIFAPTGNIKRGEIATILDRAITTYVNTPDTEVTATGKGITLIAAPGVTVKGEAEDILVAPAATGTTKLDGVKVSGAVTMQAAKGTLALNGATTAAKLNVPALATGAKITVDKDATVAAVSSSADDVAIDGNGNITNMTVETGKGVTVAGSVKVGKITNNGSDSMKHGNTTIAGKGQTTNKPTTGGGSSGGSGGGGNGGGGGNQGGDETYATAVTKTVKTRDELETAVKNATGKVWIKMDTASNGAEQTLGDVTLINNNENLKSLKIDLTTSTADELVVRSKTVDNIAIVSDHSNDSSYATTEVKTLKLEAGDAEVETSVVVDTADVEAVKANSYRPKKTHKKINMKGSGKLDVPSNVKVEEVEVLTKNKGDTVKISGDVKTLTVKSPAEIILDAITSALTLTSENKNANITVNSAKVTVSGTVGTLNVAKNTSVALDKDATVATAKTKDGAAITGSGSVSTLEATGNVTVSGAKVSILNTSTTTTTVTLAGGATVTSITTSTSLTIESSGTGNTVGSVDVSTTATADGSVKITAAAGVKVEQVTAVGDTEKGAIDVSGVEGVTSDKIKSKAPAPTLDPELNKEWGKPTTVKVTSKYATKYIAANADASEAPENVDANGSFEVPSTGGTYLVWVPESGTTLASEKVSIIVPAQVGVEEAEILGTPVAGQTLKAVANSTKENAADAPLKYDWTYNGAAIEGVKDTDAAITADKTGTYAVTISNYNGKKSAPASVVVTDDAKKDLEALVAAVEARLKDVPVKDAGTTPDQVEDGTKYFVNNDAFKALQAALKDAKEKLADTTTTQSDLNAALQTLSRANNAVKLETGTKTEPATKYAIKVAGNLQNVTVTTDPTGSAAEGTEVTVTATPATGYDVDAITVTGANNTPVTVTNGKFKMPASEVTVSATAVAKPAADESQLTVNFADTSDKGEITVTQDSGNIKGTEKFNVKKNADATVSVKFARNVDSAKYVIGDSTQSVDMQITGDTATATIAKAQLANNVTMTITAKLAEAKTSEVKIATDDITKKFNVTFTPESPVAEGETVTVTIAPATGSDVTVANFEVKVDDADTTVTPVEGETGKYTFKMPAKDVTISVTEKAAAEKVTVTFDTTAATGAKVYAPATSTTEITAPVKVPNNAAYSFRVTPPTGKTVVVKIGETPLPATGENNDTYEIKVDQLEAAAEGKLTVTISEEEVFEVNATFSFTTGAVTVKDAAGDISTGAVKKMSSDTPFTFTAKVVNQNKEIAVSAKTNDNAVVEVEPDKNVANGYVIQTSEIAKLNGKTVTITIAAEDKITATFVKASGQSNTKLSVKPQNATDPFADASIKESSSDAVTSAAKNTDFVFTATTDNTPSKVVTVSKVKVGGTEMSADDLKKFVTQDDDTFTIDKSKVTNSLEIELKEVATSQVTFQGTEGSEIVKDFAEGITSVTVDSATVNELAGDLAAGKSAYVKPGDNLVFTVNHTLGTGKVPTVTISDGTNAITATRSGSTFTVPTDQLVSGGNAKPNVTVIIDVDDALTVEFKGNATGGALPTGITILKDGEGLPESNTVEATPNEAYTFQMYYSGQDKPVVIEPDDVTVAAKKATADVTISLGAEKAVTKVGNKFVVNSKYFNPETVDKVIITVAPDTAAANAVKVAGAPVTDRLINPGAGPNDELLKKYRVNAVASAPSEADAKLGADYQIKLTSNYPIPLHLSGQPRFGNHVGFGISYFTGAGATNAAYEGGYTRAKIAVSTAGFDKVGDFSGFDSAVKIGTNADYTKNTFDGADDPCYGTFYFGNPKDNQKYYAVINWYAAQEIASTLSDAASDVVKTDYVVIDLSDVETTDTLAPEIVAKLKAGMKSETNGGTQTSLDTGIQIKEITATKDAKPTITVTLEKSTSDPIANGFDGLPNYLKTDDDNEYDVESVDVAINALTEANNTVYTGQWGASYTPVEFLKALGKFATPAVTEVNLMQENPALIMFPQDDRIAFYAGATAQTTYAAATATRGVKAGNKLTLEDLTTKTLSNIVFPGTEVTIKVYKGTTYSQSTAIGKLEELTDANLLGTIVFKAPAATEFSDTLYMPVEPES